MKPVKVAHLISSLGRGGRERQMATIYGNTDKAKVSTKVICYKNTEHSYVEEYTMSQDVIFLKKQSVPGRLFEILDILRREKFSIIWTWGGVEATLGILLSLITKVRHINGSVRHGIVLKSFSHRWRKAILHLSRYIVANSKAGLKANGLSRGYVMYNGLDKGFFTGRKDDSVELRKRLGIPADQFCVISVANLVPFKDYPTILYALQKVKENGINFHYFIIGEGPERNPIKNLISNLSLTGNVTLLGRQSSVKDYLQISDIFIHSSRGEGCSNAILEAMASGVPVIATDTGGTNEIVDSSTGRLFDYQDTGQLISHLTDLFSSEELRTMLGRNSLEKVRKKFSIDRMMSEYYSILEKVNA